MNNTFKGIGIGLVAGYLLTLIIIDTAGKQLVDKEHYYQTQIGKGLVQKERMLPIQDGMGQTRC